MNKYLQFFILIICTLVIQNSVWGQGNEPRIIKGTIIDKKTGEPLLGVTVAEININNRPMSGVVTDLNGQFVIRIGNPQNKLVISSVGYKTITYNPVPNTATLNLALEEETQELATVTITAKAMHNDGAISIPQREISTATQKISTQEFEGVQVTSIDEAIQGRIAGLDIVANSGDPGSGTTMRIRGASSINTNSQPLIVINGIPYETQIDPNFDFANANQEQFANMLSINPDDILEITVLKDAASTAIWGSKGANGVLSITTKKGARGKTQINYTYRFSRKIQPRGRNLLNGDDFTMLMKQELFNPFQNDAEADVDEYNYDPNFSEYKNYNNNTDWYSVVTKPGYTHDHYVSASGGGEKANYRISGGYLYETGTIIGQYLNRLSARSYLDYSVSDRLKFISEFSFTYTDNHKNYINNSDNKSSILDIAYNKMPNVSIYDQNSTESNPPYYNININSGISYDQKYLKNPVALALDAKNIATNYRIVPTFRINYDLLDPAKQMLRYQMYVSFDLDKNENLLSLPKTASNLPIGNEQVNRVENSNGLNLTVQTDQNITWVPKFKNKDHDLLVYGSFQLRAGKSSPYGVSSNNFASSGIVEGTASGNLTSLYSTPGQWRSMALMTRMHYTFKERYIFDLTLRRDGSTKFGEDQKFGNFPGISAKWIISDEPFMENFRNKISMLAIRPSWGISGRQPDAEYLFQSRVKTYGNYMDMGAYIPSSVPLSNLRWEKSMSYNMGMDLGFFNDMLIFDLNTYYTIVSDILFKNVVISDVSGYANLPWANLGKMKNIGWEVNFNGNKVIKYRDFSVDFQFNIANNKNTLLKLDDLLLNTFNQDYGYNNGEYLGRIQVGNAWGSIYGFRYKGVYQYNEYNPDEGHNNAPVARDAQGNIIKDYNGNPLPMKFAYGVEGKEYTFQGGDAIYEDINHDGSIDKLDIVYLGNSNPKLNGGFGTTLHYKSFALTAFFNFRYGNKIVNVSRMYSENMYSDNNQSIAVNWRWRKDGDVTEMPRALYGYGYNWLGSDRYVEDGSFLRFKYLTLRYNMPNGFAKKINMKSINFYFTFNNIAVFSKYSGIDPEVGYGNVVNDNGMAFDRNKTPRSRDFTLGLTLGF